MLGANAVLPHFVVPSSACRPLFKETGRAMRTEPALCTDIEDRLHVRAAIPAQPLAKRK